jgi:hypothetical protein
MKKFTFVDLLAVLGALLLTGLGVAAKHPEAALSLLAVVLIWVINFLFTWRGIKLHKSWLTTGLFAVALGLTALFQPALIPLWPNLAGNSQEIAAAIASWIGQMIISAGPIVAYATGLYSIILAKVLEKLLYQPQLK